MSDAVFPGSFLLLVRLESVTSRTSPYTFSRGET